MEGRSLVYLIPVTKAALVADGKRQQETTKRAEGGVSGLSSDKAPRNLTQEWAEPLLSGKLQSSGLVCSAYRIVRRVVA